MAPGGAKRRWIAAAGAVAVVAGVAVVLVLAQDDELTPSETCEVEPRETRLRSSLPPGVADAAGGDAAEDAGDADPSFRPGGAASVHAWKAGQVGYDAGGFRSLYTVGLGFVAGAPVTTR